VTDTVSTVRPARNAVGVLLSEQAAGENMPDGQSEDETECSTGPPLPMPVLSSVLNSRTQRLILANTRTLIRGLSFSDTYTLRHSQRVTALAVRLATALKVDEDQLRLIQLSGLLHDVGKVAVSPAILNKRKPLSHSEFHIVKGHADAGCELIRSLEHAEPVACAVRHHHERWDGQGYPDRLEGENIPLASRFLGVADAYDAMASYRPYQEVLSPAAIALELHREKGKQFDPAIVEQLLSWHKGPSPSVSPMSACFRPRPCHRHVMSRPRNGQPGSDGDGM